MKFIDDNHIEGEMSDKEFLEYVNEIKQINQMNKSNKGYEEVYSEKRIYKNIPYEIIIIRAYIIIDPSKKVFNKIGKFAMIRTPENLDRFKEIIDKMNRIAENDDIPYLNFLYEDTRHSHQEEWTLKQMVEWLDKEIKNQIDGLDNIFIKFLSTIENKITEFNKLFKEFTEIKEKLERNKIENI